MAAFEAVPGNIEEAWDEQQIPGSCIDHIGDMTHEVRHDSSTDDAHDDDTGCRLDQILWHIDNPQGKDGRETDGHEEKYGNEKEYGCAAGNDIQQYDEDDVNS